VAHEVQHWQNLRAAIADDEPLSRKKTRLLLSREPGIQIVGEFNGLEEAVAGLKKHRPDLLVLAIEIAGKNTLEVLQKIAREELPALIFTTTYDDPRLELFKSRSLNVLAKPFDQERLHVAVAQARAECFS